MLAALIAQAPGYMIVAEGPELVFTHANRAACELSGHQQLVGQSARALFQGTPVLAVVERVYASGQAETFTESAPLLADHPASMRYLTRTHAPLKDRDGAVRGVITMGMNVTDDV